MTLKFTNKEAIKEAKTKKKQIFNFLNMHSLYLFNKNSSFKKSVTFKEVVNFPDGNFIAKKLKIFQQRGPDFTSTFLHSNYGRTKKHFFIGLKKEDIEKISNITGIPKTNIGTHNPPIVQEGFSTKNKTTIIKKINKFNPDYLWICIGNPKQEILSHQIFEEVTVNKIFNVGAAMDFFLNKKKEAPWIWRKLAVEWAYRGITDFKHSKTKILRSFIALKYLNLIELEE